MLASKGHNATHLPSIHNFSCAMGDLVGSSSSPSLYFFKSLSQETQIMSSIILISPLFLTIFPKDGTLTPPFNKFFGQLTGLALETCTPNQELDRDAITSELRTRTDVTLELATHQPSS